MRKLGLIGGTGPESTIDYYRLIEQGVRERTGRLPRLVIESLSVFDVLAFCEAGDYAGLCDYLVDGFGCLAAAGADLGCLTGITPHVVFDEVQARTSIPLVSMLATTCDEAVAHGYETVGLLGTYPTMSQSFVKDALARKGVRAVVPPEDEMRYVGNKIASELELGLVLPKTRDGLCRIARRLVEEQGAQAIVLGCTELPMILGGEVLEAPVLDVMQIHIEKLISLLAESAEAGV